MKYLKNPNLKGIVVVNAGCGNQCFGRCGRLGSCFLV